MPADLRPVHELVELRAAQLRSQAFSAGERLYAESPKAFTKRIRKYWRAWRGEFVDERPVGAPPASAF